jgi:hypothetical protein
MSLEKTRKKTWKKPHAFRELTTIKRTKNTEFKFLRMPWPALEDGVLLRRAIQRGDPAVSAVAPFRTPHSKILIEMLNAPFRTQDSKILIEMLNLLKTAYRFTLSQ